MAWLQNLAGRAEDLLNKIDQNAATVLNESSSSSKLVDDEIQVQDLNYVIGTKETESNNKIKISPLNGKISRNSSFNNSPNKDISPAVEKDVTDGSIFEVPNESNGVVIGDESYLEDSVKSSLKSDKMSSSSSVHNSFVLAEETQLLHEKIARLELDNQDLNKQLLNMHHIYSALRNENSNLQFQIERANEQAAEAQLEKDQYLARAQRILQEKEHLLSLNQAATSEDDNIFASYNAELKKELEFHQTKTEELSQKNAQLLKEVQSLQMQHQVIQNGLQATNQSLEQTLNNERKIRAIAEEDYQLKSKELHKTQQDLNNLQGIIKMKNNEICTLQETLKNKSKNVSDEDIESRIKSLTQTLMVKQNNLETITTERNALRLQIEKLENEYKKNLAQMSKSQAKVINIGEPDDSIPVPVFMRVSPFDAGVTRRVKHAYSTLDSVSIRTGIFLRRYPVARVFVFCYMVLLHIWVLIILFLYVPSNH
ncbi:unnamed protein product [Phyllotreta striolata]|uniref:Golgin-84 n=1 Tax=Phyllotreta striolata TaxID=444603 RepID=A0A9N9TH61_PHYSR|nr:unnamed protein product [Phyllotreta striolata]